MSEHYKALIPDDVVIQELIKESRRRLNQSVESARLKPNLNFFQRTVNGLVSTNNRIEKSLHAVKVKASNQKYKKSKTLVIPTLTSSPKISPKKKIHFVSAATEISKSSHGYLGFSYKTRNNKKFKTSDKLKELEKYIEGVSTDSEDDSGDSVVYIKTDKHLYDRYSKKATPKSENSSVILISSSDDDFS